VAKNLRRAVLDVDATRRLLGRPRAGVARAWRRAGHVRCAGRSDHAEADATMHPSEFLGFGSSTAIRAAAILAIAVPTIAATQSTTHPDSTAHLIREAQEAVTDPTSPILSFTHSFTFIPSFYGDEFRGQSAWTYQVTPSVPFTIWGMTHVLRATVGGVLGGPESFSNPTITHVITGSTVSSTGLTRRWGIGTHFEPVPETDTIHGAHVLIGPELAYFAELNELWFGGVSLLGSFGKSTEFAELTPTVEFTEGRWSIGTSKTIEYDFKLHEWTFLPLGPTISYVVPIAHEEVDVFVAPTYEVVRDPGFPKWTVEFGIVIAPPLHIPK
jgi:hypothetical protein